MLRISAFVLSLLILPFSSFAADKPLTIVQSGPQGEIASLAEANEVRVVFSEPMVTLGRIPDPVTAPFFKITPAIPGTFRWSGTTTLIFTPDPKKTLPNATRYVVTIDPSATSVAGKKLGRAFTFDFTTPTIRLLSTTSSRRHGRFTDPVLLYLRFNQPVSANAVAGHIKLRYKPHDWDPPSFSGVETERLKRVAPESLAAFNAKVDKALAVTKSQSVVFASVATEWDKKRFPPSKDLVVLETPPNVPTDAWIELTLDENAPAVTGPETPGKIQQYTVRLEPTFFVKGFRCNSECDPEEFNPIQLRNRAEIKELRKHASAFDITDPAHEIALKQSKAKPATNDEEGEYDDEEGDDENYEYRNTSNIPLDQLGFPQQAPARTYAVKLDPTLTSTDGQTLGYTWVGISENWHAKAFTSFGDGHGVWEKSGGTVLPFSARNFKDVTQWAHKLTLDSLMPTIVDLQNKGFDRTPEGAGTHRTLNPTPDRIQSFGLNLAPALDPNGSGLVWAAIREGNPIPKSRTYEDKRALSSIIQVTNLGISVKDSPQNTLIFVTTLDTAAPVADAVVSIRTTDNKVFWTGRTDKNGLAIAPNTVLRPIEDSWEFSFIVTAEKEGDIAYVASNWNEGVDSWDFGYSFTLQESIPLIRGTIFTDRGVYKLGEQVHFKAILRSDTPTGIQLYPAGTKVSVTLKDARDNEVDSREVPLTAWSSAEWTLDLPQNGSLGTYSLEATIAGQHQSVYSNFLVAAYRRPDFRVDVSLVSDSPLAGTNLNGTVNGRYLFGGAMSGRTVEWTYSKEPYWSPPDAISKKYPPELYTFLGCECDRSIYERGTISKNESKLDAKGLENLKLETKLDAGIPYIYTLEGNVTDISRQKIAGRKSFVVHPAPWYIGVKSPPYFVDQEKGIDTEIIAATPEGLSAPGVPVKVTLTQIQWNSVRRAEGNGFYSWDTERKEVPAGEWSVTTASTPAPLHIAIPHGGYYFLTATATDPEKRSTQTTVSFYSLGSGYTAWQRYDNNRIDLVPERKTYKPGDTARVMIQSPWEQATALVTTEREGIRTQKQFSLTSTQQTISVPISEKDIPNVFISVLLVKGRTKEAVTEDASDPGKPAFRLGYTELTVEDATKKLKVDVSANRTDYKPANKAKVNVEVHDAANRPVQSEVTLWAVDYGVLSLTGYETPEVLKSVYIEKALQVMNEDSRQRIVSRRVLTPKGATDGGGGGKDGGPGMLRKDFRVLAFWLGSVTTNGRGKASVEVKLPESLTTYRIMAVAADKGSRFGSADTEIRINKPLLLRATFPRFMAVGDEAFFGAAVNSQLKQPGNATVTIKSLDPNVLTFTQQDSQQLPLQAEGSAEARFAAKAVSSGTARIQMTVRMNGESDAFEDTFPVEVIVSPEVVAAYGQTKDSAKEVVEIPGGVIPTFGGLHLELSSTAMVGLSEGAKYLVEYPYGCAEQKSSTALALMLVSDLGAEFNLADVPAANGKKASQAAIDDLRRFQCPDGGFAFWAGECQTENPYLTSNVLHVHQTAQKLGYSVDGAVLQAGYKYLQEQLAVAPPQNEGWMPAYNAWQSFAIKVLTEGGVNQDSNINRIFGYLDRMPVFGLAYLGDALIAKGETGKRLAEIDRRIGNSILPEAGSAHVEELADPYLLWFWNSNIRSTGIVIDHLTRAGASEEMMRPLVRWMMNARKKGRWGNTQENAVAMESLVDYYRKYESEVPDFRASVTAGANQIVGEDFRGRSTAAKSSDMPMSKLLGSGKSGDKFDLTFTKQGTGTLFYLGRLTYAPAATQLDPKNQGFQVERSYAVVKGSVDGKPATSFAAGDLIRVTLTMRLPKERRYVAVTDPLAAGFEPVESWFATTAAELANQQDDSDQGGDWMSWWERGGFDHVERHDDRVNLFATRLSEGKHVYSYLVRATTSGSFNAAPTRAEEMYEPEVFGRSASTPISVDK